MQFVPSSYGQPQMPISMGSQFVTMSQVHAQSSSVGGQHGASVSQSSATVTPSQNIREQPAVVTSSIEVCIYVTLNGLN